MSTTLLKIKTRYTLSLKLVNLGWTILKIILKLVRIMLKISFVVSFSNLLKIETDIIEELPVENIIALYGWR
jgi:hypothetical protein